MSDIVNQSFTIVGGSSGGENDWCSEIEYREVDFCQVEAYMRRSQRRGCCFPAALFFALDTSLCHKGHFPVPTDEGVPKSLPILPLGYHYAQTSTDSKHRALQGIWAKDRGKIYLVPWINSTETGVVKWDGIKRVWNDADPIDDDPLLLEAVTEYVRWKHLINWQRDEGQAAAAMEAFIVARAKLVHQCREETRARRCEPSLARSSPGTLYYNDQQSFTATCPDGQTGAAVTEIIPAGTVASTKSVADANAIAKKQAQDQANARLDCTPTPTTYWNTAQTYVATCAQTQGAPIPDGDPVTITIPANSFSSTVSQAEADALALAEATAQATAGLSCVWWNSEQSYTNVCVSNTALNVTRTTPAHTNSSNVSQAIADADALAAAKLAADEASTCPNITVYRNTQQSVQVLLPGCVNHPQCQIIVTVTVRENVFSSTVSQSDANQQARNYGTNYGNQQAFFRCEEGNCGSSFEYTIP